MNFIIDRTAEDVMYAQSFASAIWSKMSNEQKAEWLKGISTPPETLKGFFNYTDMRRIVHNYNSLIQTYSYSGSAISTSYIISTIPNRTTMSADFEKIRQFGYDKLPYFYEASFNDYRTPNTLSSDVNKINYEFVNNYEHILKCLYDYNNDGFLMVECDYDTDDTETKQDGILIGSDTHTVDVTIPSGYFINIEKGHFTSSGYAVGSRATRRTTGTPITISLDSSNYGVWFSVTSGVVDDTLVLNYGTGGNAIDTTNYDTVKLDCDMLEYSAPTTYTATEIQSSMIDVTSLVKMYCYNISDYGDSTIVTLYDANQDEFDEVALREDTFIDLTNVSYITFDTEVGTEITYITSSGSTLSQLFVKVGSGEYVSYPEHTEFDVSSANQITIMYPAPSGKFVCTLQNSINGGLDISQLDTNDIEVKYV